MKNTSKANRTADTASRPGQRTATHSIRCTDDLWAAAKRRATFEGTSINSVLTEILEGYALGKINLPRVVKEF